MTRTPALAALLETLRADTREYSAIEDAGAALARRWAHFRAEADVLEESDETRVRASLAFALARVRRDEVDEQRWIRLLLDPHPTVTDFAIDTQRRRWTEGAQRALRVVLDGPSFTARHVKALAAQRDPADERRFRDIAAEQEGETQVAAIQALGRMPTLAPETCAVLVNAILTDSIRNVAMQALVQHINRSGPDVVRTIVKNAELDRILGRAIGAGTSPIERSLRSVAGFDSPAPAPAPAPAKSVDPLAALRSFGHAVGRSDEREHAYRHGPSSEVERIAERLTGSGDPSSARRSVILVGPPRVGKTNLIHALARHLAAQDAPWHVLETSTGEVMAGTKWQGEWETRLKSLIDGASAPHRVIVYLTDIQSLAWQGRNSQRDTGFAELLMPYLGRGVLALIGEATPETLRNGFDRNEMLRRVFEQIRLEEPSIEATREIVSERLAYSSRRDGVHYELAPVVLEGLLDYGRVASPEAARPGVAIQLLEQVIEERRRQREANSDAVAGTASREQLVRIDGSDITRALALSTGMPSALLDDEVPFDVGAARAFFEERVLGQPEAIDIAVELVTLIKAGLTDPDRPYGSLFFVGPTGVGKTELAKSLAEYLFGSSERMLRFDMSEYRDWDSFERLIGSAQNRTSEGILTRKVRESPFSIVLLDEIEKAHANVHDLLLQVLDDGRLTDGQGRTADFRRTVVIMTSNIGSRIEIDALGFGAKGDRAPSEEAVLREVRKVFRPELVNRFGRVVVFRPLSREILRVLVRRELGKAALRAGVMRRRAVVDIAPELVDLLVKEGFSIAYGARPLKRRVERRVLLPIAHALVRLGADAPGTVIRVTTRGDEVEVRLIAAAAPVTARATTSIDTPALGANTDDLSQRFETIRQRLATVLAHPRLADEHTRRAELLEQTRQRTFWDQPSRAREALSELAELDARVASFAELEARVDGARELIEDASRRPDLRARAGAVLVELDRAVCDGEYRTFVERAEDRADVFLSVRRVGASKEDASFTERLGAMYDAWARAHRIDVVVLDEQRDTRGLISQTWYWEGGADHSNALFGSLRDEAGLHRLEHGGRGAERRSSVVRVDVSPYPRTSVDGVEVRRSVRRGRVHNVLTYEPGSLVLELDVERSEDSPERRGVLGAFVTSQLAGRVSTRDDLVRHYGVEGRFVVDSDTGERLREKDLPSTGLDTIFAARVRKRMREFAAPDSRDSRPATSGPAAPDSEAITDP